MILKKPKERPTKQCTRILKTLYVLEQDGNQNESKKKKKKNGKKPFQKQKFNTPLIKTTYKALPALFLANN